MIIDTTQEQKYNVYFLAYLNVHGIKDGEEVMPVDYMRWIGNKHTAFRELKKCGYYNGFPPEVRDEFIRFIYGSFQNGNNQEEVTISA